MQLSQTAQKLLTRGQAVPEDLNAVTLPLPVPRLRLVGKPSKLAVKRVTEKNNHAAEAAARVAARFASMPSYGIVGALEGDARRAPDTGSGSRGSGSLKSIATAVRTLANEEGRQIMSTCLMPATEERRAIHPLSEVLRQGRAPEAGLPVRMDVRLSIFEVGPVELQPQIAVAPASAAAAAASEDAGAAEAMPAHALEEPVAVAAWENVPERRSATLEREAAGPATEAADRARCALTAPMNRRLMAGCFDLSLLALAFAAALVELVHSQPVVLQGRGALASVVDVAIVSLLVYRGLFGVLLRVTPGQMIAGVRIVDCDGKRAGRLRLALRQILLPLSAAPVCLGFLCALFDVEGRGWHDRLSGTHSQAYY